MTHTPESLRAFAARVAEQVPNIKAPVHLSGGNEQQLIEYFANHHRPGDWVFATWRSHYAALLAGVPEEQVFAAICAGRSITLCFPEHRFFSSAIVAGHLPVALGVAMGITRKIDPFYEGSDPRLNYSILGEGNEPNRRPRVHVFLGDMAAQTGLFYECRRYAVGHDLPIHWIVEDNGLSVCTPTAEAWGEYRPRVDTTYYRYAPVWPHAGAKQRTNF